ncbi:MAG: hypothetical protein ACYCUM_10440 [Solirubrobacteraceae bacterium]
MTRVVALVPDLLFGSNLLGALRAAGMQAQQASSVEAAEQALAGARVAAHQLGQADRDHETRPPADARLPTHVLIVDLTGQIDGAAALVSLRERRALCRVKTLAFYSHVDANMRQRALHAGFDLVVPRSRLAREAAALVNRLARGSSR